MTVYFIRYRKEAGKIETAWFSREPKYDQAYKGYPIVGKGSSYTNT